MTTIARTFSPLFARLNEKSQHAQGEGRRIPWAAGADPEKFWLAEDFTHLFYLPLYERLALDEKRVYNQKFALLFAEEFIFLEKDVILPIIRKKLRTARRAADPAYITALENFEREENEHVEMFWTLLEKSDGRFRKKRGHHYFAVSLASRLFVRLMILFPRVFIFWVWLAAYFEERTVSLYRSMKRTTVAEPDLLDPLHLNVHRSHMEDESRHVQMDEFFVHAFWDPAPTWLKHVNIWLFKLVLEKVFVYGFTARQFWLTAIDDAPGLAKFTSEFEAQIGALRENSDYQAQVFSKDSSPRTFKLLKQREETRPLATVLTHLS